jgi:hypothetical protein
MKSNLTRTLLIGFIWFGASIDVWCCQWLDPVADPGAELNPIARMLMVNYGIWGMVGLKVFGTFLATEWLRHLSIVYSYAMAIGMLTVLLILVGVIPV